MKKLLLIFRFLALNAFAIHSAMAQSKKITGKVVSADDGQPLPGVSVTIPGTTRGVLTDGDGNFTIPVAVGQTLKFTYVGFITQTAVVSGNAMASIKLVTNT